MTYWRSFFFFFFFWRSCNTMALDNEEILMLICKVVLTFSTNYTYIAASVIIASAMRF